MSLYTDIVARQIDTRRRSRRGLTPVTPLADFIPAISPWLSSPHHLAPLLKLIERVPHEPVRAVVSMPPQHGKTTTLLHGMAWLLKQYPRRTNAYVSYAIEFARSKSEHGRRYAEAAGVDLDPAINRLTEWRTRQGGGLLVTGIGGPLTGHGIDGLLLVDDPVKNPQQAESRSMRDQHWDWFNQVAYTRLAKGASIIVCQTRWHIDDLAGRLIKAGWQYINLPALNEADSALWPEKFPASALRETRAQLGPHAWAAQYQGEPIPRGGTVFSDAHYYDTLPEGGYRAVAGADWGYTAATHSDWSVVLEGRIYEGKIYLTRMIRAQERPAAFAERLRGLEARVLHSYMSGTELAQAEFLQRLIGVKVEVLRATSDKFVRAQPVAAAWARGDILLPANAPWVPSLLDEVLDFTGINDRHDDIVDAMASLYAALPRQRQPYVSTAGMFPRRV